MMAVDQPIGEMLVLSGLDIVSWQRNLCSPFSRLDLGVLNRDTVFLRGVSAILGVKRRSSSNFLVGNFIVF